MSDNSVPLATAQADIQNWLDYCDNLSITDTVKAFNIPLDSLTPLLSITGITGIRAYIGLPDAGEMAGMHLFLVAIDNKGDDIIADGDVSLIMNFIAPCPPTCAATSPLNL